MNLKIGADTITSNVGAMLDIYNIMNAEYHRISDSLRRLFKEANIYIGGIERSQYDGKNDELCDLEIYSNFRVYFSNHEENWYLPFNVITKIEEICGTNYTLYFVQTGVKYSKSLYLYLHIDAKEEYLKSLIDD